LGNVEEMKNSQFRKIGLYVVTLFGILAIPLMATPVFELFNPTPGAMVARDIVLVKGVNRSEGLVFVNGKKIDVFEDGRFFYKLPVTEFGPKEVSVSYLDRKGLMQTVTRDVTRVTLPDYVSLGNPDRDLFIEYANSIIAPPPEVVMQLQEVVTRGELADFIYRLSSGELLNVKTLNKENWADDAIKWTLDRRLMANLPDGLFHPEKPVARLEWLIALYRADLLKNGKASNHEFQDVPRSHWAAKYVYAGLENGLIKNDINFASGDPVSRSVFWKGGKQVIKALGKPELLAFRFNEGAFADRMKIDSENHLKDVTAYMASSKIREASAKEKVSSPSEKNPVVSNAPLPSPADVSNLDNAAPPSTVFTDMTGHWARHTVADMARIGLIPETALFEPKHVVEKAELAQSLVKWFELKKAKGKLAIADISASDNARLSIYTAVSLGLMSVDKSNRFNPRKTVNRAEAYAALIRVLELKKQLNMVENADPEPKFDDVDQENWAYGMFAQASRAGLIADHGRIFPNRKLTKVELVAIVSKVPMIKAKLSGADMPND